MNSILFIGGVRDGERHTDPKIFTVTVRRPRAKMSTAELSVVPTSGFDVVEETYLRGTNHAHGIQYDFYRHESIALEDVYLTLLAGYRVAETSKPALTGLERQRLENILAEKESELMMLRVSATDTVRAVSAEGDEAIRMLGEIGARVRTLIPWIRTSGGQTKPFPFDVQAALDELQGWLDSLPPPLTVVPKDEPKGAA